MEPAITSALESEAGGKLLDSSLDKYVGTYSAQPWGGEIAVFHWKDELAMLSLPSNDPLEALQELRRTAGNVFRRVRDDGELGEEIEFELDERGMVTGLTRVLLTRSLPHGWRELARDISACPPK